MVKIDLSKSSDALVYDLLTESAGKTISPLDVSYANIAAIGGAQAGQPNATVQLSSVAGSTVVKPGGVEPLTRKVTRHTLAAVAADLNKDLDIEDDITEYDDPAYAVTKLNSILGSVLAPQDVTVTPAAAVDGVRAVNITMKDGAHIALYGSLVLNVTDNVDHRTTTGATFPDENLSGFDAPDPA